MEVNIYKDKQEVAQEFSKYLKDFVAGKEAVHMALSGGSTPKIVFDVLADLYAEEINWNTIHLFWGDERCVPPTHDDSNYKMTVDHLLSKINIPEENIHRIKGENKPDYEAERYSQVLEEKLPLENSIPQFDLVILGMGDDGHTASIFPHEIDLWKSNKNCVVAIHPDSGQKRVSITGKIINNAKEVAFLVTGASKSEKVRIITKKEPGSDTFPAKLVSPTSKKLQWFLDEDAASELK